MKNDPRFERACVADAKRRQVKDSLSQQCQAILDVQQAMHPRAMALSIDMLRAMSAPSKKTAETK